MNPLAKLIVERAWQAWTVVIALALAAGMLAGQQTLERRQQERLSRLETEVERSAIELMSQTLNGNLMGSVAVLGLIDEQIKKEAQGKLPANNPQVLPQLESIGRSYDADGVFVVAQSGIIASSWDNAGKPSTNLNVKFRPYYQMAMQGMDNVYAAVSLARGDRALYFSSPVFIEPTNGTEAIGAVVARTGLIKVDNLLRQRGDIAFLLSPQGVVFASSRAEWISMLAGVPTPERVRAIRELKQFGKIFDEKEPARLPVEVAPGIQSFEQKPFALATAKLQWNDPFGDWTVVLMEDLDGTVSQRGPWLIGIGVGLAVLLLGAMMLVVMRNEYRQAQASSQLASFARVQEISATRKMRVVAASVQMQRTATLPALATTFLEQAHELLGVQQGCIYVHRENEQALTLAGSYACAELPPERIVFGEGLLGQCAVERRRQLLDISSEGYAMIRSGLGEVAPRSLLIAPVVLNEMLLAVVELASLETVDEAMLSTLDELLPLLAMNIEIVGRSDQTQALLAVKVAAEQESNERLLFQQALLDTIPYPVFYKGPDTRFRGFNHAYEQAFGVLRDDLLGLRVIDLTYLPEADRQAYQQEDERVIAEATTVQREASMPFADGTLHDTLYFVAGFRLSNGQPGGLVGTFIDVTDMKAAQREMARLGDVDRFNRLAHGREQRIIELKREVNALAEKLGLAEPYATTLVEPVGDHDVPPHPDYRTTVDPAALSLDELVDLKELQQLFSAFCDSVGIAAAIIDLDGKVLASARWQRACTDFHRVNPMTCARCIESDTELASNLSDGEAFTLYTCKNGMTDAASPIIVEGRHLANVFIGQFHLQSPDEHFFRAQAGAAGFDEADYLAAIKAAPIVDEQRLPTIIGFLTGFARMISTMSLARRRADAAQLHLERQAVLLKEERVAALSLAEDAEQARQRLAQIAKEST